MMRSPVWEDQRSVRCSVHGAISSAEAVEHQLVPVVELHTEPIPSDLVFREVCGAELMIHPTQSCDCLGLSVERECAGRRQPGQRIVMGGLPWGGSLSADSPIAMDDRRLLRGQHEVNREVLRRGLEMMGIVLSRGRLCEPTINPDAQPSSLGASLAKAGAARFFGVSEPPFVQVRQSEVGQVEMPDRPARGVRSGLLLGKAPSEKCQLVAETSAAFRREVAGVVPPLSTELVMGSVVLREALGVSRTCEAKHGIRYNGGDYAVPGLWIYRRERREEDDESD